MNTNQSDEYFLKWQKNVFNMDLDFFSLIHVPYSNMEDVGFMTCTEASHRGAIKTFQLRFWGAVLLSIFMYSLCYIHRENICVNIINCYFFK